MTLILALATEHEAHMTCDFKLTDAANGGRTISLDAHKLVQTHLGDCSALVGVTGLAFFGRTPVADWVAERLGMLRLDGSLEGALQELESASEELKRVRPADHKHRRLTFVVAAIQGSQSVICTLSNFETLAGEFLDWSEVPGHELVRSVSRPSSPRLVIAGSKGSIRKEERKNLERILRAGADGSRIRSTMASLNARAAQRSSAVSAGCNAASEFATGRGEGEAHLVEQMGDFIPPDLAKIFKDTGMKLQRAIGPDGKPMPLRVVSSASGVHRPSVTFFREQFKLRPNDSELWNNFGAFEVDRGRIEPGRAAYQKALELNPNNYMAARNLGVITWESYGDRAAGIELITQALGSDDQNFRRETVMTLAQMHLRVDRDWSTAAPLFEEAINGPIIPNISAHWALAFLHHAPAMCGAVESTLTEALAQAPNDRLTISAYALNAWWTERDLPRARGFLEEKLEGNPKDEVLLCRSAHLALGDEDLDASEALIRRLSKVARPTKGLVEAFTWMKDISRGATLETLLATAEKNPDPHVQCNRALILWAQGKTNESKNIASKLDLMQLDYHARAEIDSLGHLLSQETPRVNAANLISTEHSIIYDPVTLRALAAHPEVALKRSSAIRMLLKDRLATR